MPSSVMEGSRPPRSCLTFSYSSGVRPRSRTISGVIARMGTVVMGKLYCRILKRGWIEKAFESRSLTDSKVSEKFLAPRNPTRFSQDQGNSDVSGKARSYTVANEIRHRRHRRPHRPRQNRAGEGAHRYRRRSDRK